MKRQKGITITGINLPNFNSLPPIFPAIPVNSFISLPPFNAFPNLANGPFAWNNLGKVFIKNSPTGPKKSEIHSAKAVKAAPNAAHINPFFHSAIFGLAPSLSRSAIVCAAPAIVSFFPRSVSPFLSFSNNFAT